MKARFIGVGLLWGLIGHGTGLGQTPEERIKLLEEQLEGLRQELENLKKQVENASPPESAEAATSPIPEAGPPGLAVPAVRSEPQSDPNGFRAYWRDGIRMDSANEQFRLRIGGRIMNDWAAVRADDSLVESLGQLGTFVRDGTEFRRTRLYVGGVLNDRFEFKAEFNFNETGGNLSDVYMGIRGVPVFGTLKAGHFKEPFGLEELTSSNHVTFLERSAGQGFAPSRNTGLAFQNNVVSGRMTYAAGIFRDTLPSGHSVGSGSLNITSRVTGLPYYGDGGRKLLHLGVAYSRQATPLGLSLFAARPEAHLLPPFVFTPALETGSYDLVGLEAAAVAGPFSIQSEYMKSYLDSPSSGDPSFSGFYVMGSFFLTGENRGYSRSKGAFDRVRPRHSFLDDGGAGAWELAARYSQLDLNDGPVEGGEMKNFTFGVNWYVNPYSRIMWNYVRSEVVETGNADILQMRFKIDF